MMTQEEKLEFIADQFEKEKEKLPVSLEKESVISTLKSVELSKTKKSRVIPLRRYVSAAAALVIIVTAAVFATKLHTHDNIATDNPQQEVTDVLVYMPEQDNENPYEYIEEYFVSEHEYVVEENENKKKSEIGDDFIVESSTTYNSATSAKKTTDSYGMTNTQVNGIDEGDIVKNDGKYIYTVANNRIYIVDTEKMEQTAVITDFVNEEEFPKTETNIDEIYVKGNIMTVIATEEERYASTTYVYNNQIEYKSYFCRPIDTSNSKTYITFYDISDRQNPKKQSQHNQSGSYFDSRAIGDTVYTIGYYIVNVSYEKTESQIRNECVPKIDGKRISIENIEFSRHGTDDVKSYVVISSFDMSGKTNNNSSYAYLGDVDTVYMSSERLYVISASYNQLIADSNNGSGYSTVITALKLDSGKIIFDCEGGVNGNVNNQYSMDEYNGYFRIATTDFKEKNSNVIDVSSVYILNKDLNIVGKLVDIAKNESVKSVRFINDTAYVVTYENTDPLFVIDLSDPTSPKITGKVELPGFSEYLHPISDGYLVGVGYDGNNEGADWDTVKITLFDVSDPSSPKVADEYVVDKARTDITYDPKAFVFYPEKEMIGIPMVMYDTGAKSHCSYFIVSVKDGKLEKQAELLHGFNKYNGDLAEFFRGTYIVDRVYTVTEKGICSFDINKGNKLNELRFKELIK